MRRQSIRRLPIFALLGANTISQLGNTITLVAIPWFVLLTWGSASKAGLAGFAIALPLVLGGFLGGTVVDRLGHKRASVVADIASGVTIACIPLIHHTIGIEFWQLMILMFLGAVLDLPGEAARQSLVPDLTEIGGMRLERVNAAYQTIRQSSFLVGFPMAGVLIAVLGSSNVLWLNAATFAVSASLIGYVVPNVSRERDENVAGGGYLADLLEGLRFIRRERLIWSLSISNTLGNAISGSLYAVVLPVYAVQVLGSSVDLGLMLAGPGAGAVLGSVAYGLVGYRLPRRWVYCGSWVASVIPFWIMAGAPSLAIAISVLAVLGFAFSPVNPLMQTLSQERTPSRLRGRVFGARIALANAAAPVAIVATGFLIEAMGLRATMILLATAQVMSAAYVLLNPAFRDFGAVKTAMDPHPTRDREIRASQQCAPDWWLVGTGGAAMICMLMWWIVVPTGWWQAGAVLVFSIGWLMVGVGSRPWHSRWRGALLAATAYVACGLLLVLVITTIEGMQTTTLVSGQQGLAAVLLIVLAWPLVLIQVTDLAARRT